MLRWNLNSAAKFEFDQPQYHVLALLQFLCRTLHCGKVFIPLALSLIHQTQPTRQGTISSQPEEYWRDVLGGGRGRFKTCVPQRENNKCLTQHQQKNGELKTSPQKSLVLKDDGSTKAILCHLSVVLNPCPGDRSGAPQKIKFKVKSWLILQKYWSFYFIPKL